MQGLVVADKQRNQEKGVALVLVLGVVALISAWASTAAYEDLVSLKRAENMQAENRAWMASESVLVLAKLYLRMDGKDNRSDHLNEGWAQAIPLMPIDEGTVSGSIEDTNRYFNLNDIVDVTGAVQLPAVEIVRRLFSSASVDVKLVDRLVDWMDKGDTPFSVYGAEDVDYFDRNYKVKNARLDRWHELLLVDGFDKDTLDALKSVVTVRPVPANGRTWVNINTANKDVLMALFPKMLSSDAEEWMAKRPFESVGSAISGQSWLAGGDTARLNVVSDVFIVRTEAHFSKAVVREEFLLARNGQKNHVLYRQRLLGS